MPYVTEETRTALDNWERDAQTAGELNYQITKQITHYLKGALLNYQLINDVMGALEGAKQEFYHKVARPYEDKKCTENGAVY